MTDTHRLDVSRTSGVVAVEEIEELSGKVTGKWALPIQTSKLTYPLWQHVRFSANHRYVLVPTELALGGLFRNGDCVRDAKGRERCIFLVVVDLGSHREVTRESVSNDSVEQFGWLKNRTNPSEHHSRLLE